MTASSKPIMMVGGIGCILWVIGGIVALFLASIGEVLFGIGVIIASFGTMGLWQRYKELLGVLTFVLELIGGVLAMIGGVLLLANVGGGLTVAFIGQFLFGIALVLLGVILNKQGPGFIRNVMGYDLVFPTVIASIAGGCAVMGATVTVTIPAGAALGAIFLLSQ